LPQILFSIRALLKHLLHIRKTWVKAHLEDDINQIADRLKGGWAPRWRKSFTLNAQNRKSAGLRNSAKSSKKWVHHTMNHYKSKFHAVSSKFTGSKFNDGTNTDNVEEQKEHESTIAMNGSLELNALGNNNANTIQPHSHQDDDIKDNSNNMSMFDGDCFYEAAEDENELLEEEEDVYETEKYNTYHNAYG